MFTAIVIHIKGLIVCVLYVCTHVHVCACTEYRIPMLPISIQVIGAHAYRKVIVLQLHMHTNIPFLHERVTCITALANLEQSRSLLLESHTCAILPLFIHPFLQLHSFTLVLMYTTHVPN